jgi:hypothetical protein
MKRLLVFVLTNAQGTHFVQRGLYLCFPCKIADEGISAGQVFFDVFPRHLIYLSSTIPAPVVAEGEFEYAGVPVKVEFYVISNFWKFFHSSLDRSLLEPDVFVKYYENQILNKKKKECVA